MKDGIMICQQTNQPFAVHWIVLQHVDVDAMEFGQNGAETLDSCVETASCPSFRITSLG